MTKRLVRNIQESRLAVMLMLALFVGIASPSLAEEPAPFYVSCSKVKSMLIELGYDPYDSDSGSRRRIILCQVWLTDDAGIEFEQHRLKNYGDIFPINAGDLTVSTHDTNVRSIPPYFIFFGETWEKIRPAVMAICPDKIPEIPQRVLDHRPTN